MAKAKKDGRVIKLSREVFAHLAALKGEREGFDGCLRRHLGLPSRTGHEQPLRTYFIIDTPDDLIVHRKLSEARGEAILLAVRRGQRLSDKKRKDAVVTVRELP